MAGSAIAVAIEKLIGLATRLACELLEGEPDETSFIGGAFRTGGHELSWAQLADAARRRGTELRASARFESPLVFSSGAYAAVVEIDCCTGALRVVRVAAVDDAGTIINPLLVRGQVLGGVVQALGECLVEKVVHDRNGQNRSGSFTDYRLLTSAEIPPIVINAIASPTPLNPLGAKGAGEGGAVGALPAVANAVADALGGRHLDPPYTEEKLWRALQETGEPRRAGQAPHR
jgi:carbon-monoxide dehydrogenase large subunit